MGFIQFVQITIPELLIPPRWSVPVGGNHAMRSLCQQHGAAILVTFVVLVVASTTQANEVASGPANVPTGIDQFEIHPAFALERVAGEPLLHDPVDLQFDEHGTAYVVEMGGYPFASDDPEKYPVEVVIIEDTDDDGIYDRRIVFADKFQYADSILPHRGGILVASPPDIIFLKDTDGDRRADVREVWVSGFTVGNSQHNVNGLIHGLDNWIYAGNGGNSGVLFWPERHDERFPIWQRDIRFDFGRQRIEFFGPTTTGFNVAIDDWGRIYRITPRTGLPRVKPRFDRNDPRSVVRSLEHRNRWWRDTAQRLLVWWDDPVSVPELKSRRMAASIIKTSAPSAIPWAR